MDDFEKRLVRWEANLLEEPVERRPKPRDEEEYDEPEDE